MDTPSAGCAPQEVRLLGVEPQSVGTHPFGDPLNTKFHTTPLLWNCRWRAPRVKLRVIGNSVSNSELKKPKEHFLCSAKSSEKLSTFSSLLCAVPTASLLNLLAQSRSSISKCLSVGMFLFGVMTCPTNRN